MNRFIALLVLSSSFLIRATSSLSLCQLTLSPDRNKGMNVCKSAPLNQYVTTIYAKSYGLSTKASAEKNTKVLQQISSIINQSGGGIKLIFEKGIYSVGNESLSGTTNKGNTYKSEDILNFKNCSKPVTIEGNGARLKLADGLHYGSFDPKTGQAYHATRGGFYDAAYVAAPMAIIKATNNESISIQNIILDGNLPNLILGGYYGDVGIQLEADGIIAFNNRNFILNNVTAFQCGRDGLLLGNNPDTSSKQIYKVEISHCVFDGNGRQGFSYTGGNQLKCTNSKFINTGKTFNKSLNAPLYTAPGAGIDIEVEMAPISNAVFDNIYIWNNSGVGLLNDYGFKTSDITVSNSTIIGSSNYSLYGLSKRMKYIKCTIAGEGISFHTAGSTGADDVNNAKFIECTFTMDSTYFPQKKLYGFYLLDLGGGGQALFTKCKFNSANHGSIYGGFDFKFIDCEFNRDSVVYNYPNLFPANYLNARFYGINKMTSFYPYSFMVENPNKQMSKFYGPFYWNGKDISK